jgi:hypothetical protein
MGVVIDAVLHDPARLSLGDGKLPEVVTASLADSSGRLHVSALLAAALKDLW